MSLPTSLLRVLLAKGIDADTILEMSALADAEQAAKDAAREAVEEAKREKRRESNRRRQKAWYDRHIRGGCDNAVISEDNQDNGVRGVTNVRSDEQKKVLEPKKNPTGIITSSTPSGSQVSLPSKPRRFVWPSDYRDQFWAAYRRKTDRKKAMMLLDRTYRADRTPWEPVLAGAKRVSASPTGTEFLPHASTWLRNERWDDELPDKSPPPSRPPPGQRVSGLTALAHDKAAARQMERSREPTFDLDTLPFPTAQRDYPADASRGPSAARRDEPWPDRDGSGTVHDFPARRAFGG